MTRRTILLLDLPSEILIIIFYSLDLATLSSCLAANRRVKSIIDDSTLLQYRLAAQAACVEDNPRNTQIDSTQKLFALQQRRKSFTELFPDFVRTIEMKDFSIDTYAFSGDIFAATQHDSRVLQWFSLAKHELVPQQLEFHGYIQDLALAVPEEDLLVVVLTSQPLHQNAGSTGITGGVKLRFYEMSTQSPHRLAREPVIQVPIPDGRVSTLKVDICGSQVAFMVHFDGFSRLFVYDWKEGSLLMDLHGRHSAARFISADVILLVQMITGTLELWTIQNQENVPEGIVGCSRVSLKLPQLAKTGKYIIHSTDSNPKGRRLLSSEEPFHSSFTDSIVVFQVYILLHDGPATDLFLFDLVLSRRGLLKLLISVEEHGKELLWREWSPPVAHWLERDGGGNAWQQITCGQRSAFADPAPGRIRLFDFNPYTHRKLGAAQRGAILHVVSDEEIQTVDYTVESGIFGEDVSSQMGCVLADSTEETVYNGVLLDEKWVIGIRDTLEADGKLSFDVWHME
ncbi:hypothetical protein C8F04DRAFT_1078354 [Mycena alexandri]|uniref:F-box domain-containing protein n=1 Tax=Mycena alexandri TaxID=1745969 RepID=A0AAD6XBA6_9AGAR|nr:hypothetical protein C8F04DRAFT_1078354 [Mycena alexandri]